MLLRGLPEPVDPQEQAIHRNLQALVETAAVQQAESSASQHRLTTACPTGGTGLRQSNRSVHSPLLLPGMGQEAMATP